MKMHGSTVVAELEHERAQGRRRGKGARGKKEMPLCPIYKPKDKTTGAEIEQPKSGYGTILSPRSSELLMGKT